MDTKLHHCVHKSPSLDSSAPSNHTSVRSMLILSFHLCVCLPRFPPNVLYAFLISLLLGTCPTHLIFLILITLIILSEKIKLWSFSLCNLVHHSVTSCFICPYILFSSLFSNYVLTLGWGIEQVQLFYCVQSRATCRKKLFSVIRFIYLMVSEWVSMQNTWEKWEMYTKFS
jgi:hypothetical protein